MCQNALCGVGGTVMGHAVTMTPWRMFVSLLGVHFLNMCLCDTV
jgi:hypothetical protein